jgi:hypothetical protein
VSKDLVIKGNYQITSPSQMVAMSKVLKDHIIKHNLYTNIVGKNYAHVEGWQFAGGMMGLFPRVVEVENLSVGTLKKWKAEVEVVDIKTDKVVSRGFAICSNEEGKKKSFDEYAVLSMAQTRAIGKSYRNLIGWVMKLAGYEATPGEEMFKMGEMPAQQPVQPVQRTATEKVQRLCIKCMKDITEPEYNFSKKLFGKPLCRDHQKEARAKK